YLGLKARWSALGSGWASFRLVPCERRFSSHPGASTHSVLLGVGLDSSQRERTCCEIGKRHRLRGGGSVMHCLKWAFVSSYWTTCRIWPCRRVSRPVPYLVLQRLYHGAA